MKLKAGLAICAALSLVVCILVFGKKHSVVSSESPEYQQMLDELMSVETISRPPVPGSSRNTLACIYNTEVGRGIYLVDLKSLERKVIPLTNDVRRVAGWSHDSLYLAFEQKPPNTDSILKKTPSRSADEDLNESWLTIYNSDTGISTRLTTNTLVNENSFVWTGTNTYFFSSDSDDPSQRGTYWGSLGTGKVERVSDTLHSLIAMSKTAGAYLKGGNIYSFAVNRKTRKASVKKLTQFEEGDFDSIRWLRYSPTAEKFLFCARPTNSQWRYVFQVDRSTGLAKQLNDEDTYNGQWLENGAGYAYVGNSNNNFFLAIRTADRSSWTNLFEQGSVANYTVTSDETKLYATAAVGVEPQATWEYDLATKTLRPLTKGTKKELVVSKLSNPSQFNIKSFDGLTVPRPSWYR